MTPIIESKCAQPQCHGGGASPALGGGATLVSYGDAGAHFSRAYESLLAAVGSGPTPLDAPVTGRYIVPGQARKSPVIWHLSGYDTSAPDVRSHGARRYASMPPKGREPLTEDEKLTFIEWIDLGAHWVGPGRGGPGQDSFSSGGTEE